MTTPESSMWADDTQLTGKTKKLHLHPAALTQALAKNSTGLIERLLPRKKGGVLLDFLVKRKASSMQGTQYPHLWWPGPLECQLAVRPLL